MKRASLLLIFLGIFSISEAQKLPNESSISLGYERFMFGEPKGFASLGYTALFESESIYRFTHRARFFSNVLLNFNQDLYGIQAGGSYSYFFAGGAKLGMIRTLPNDTSWRFIVNPFVGVDFWIGSLTIGYNLQAESKPRNAAPLSPLGHWNYQINFYIPIKPNRKIYR
ncbi:MAG: hypothetical protein KDC92_02460 [Bacteroidetes bacterium]|nr:hypothetical protein [Bacteroidota bacterium]